MCGIVGFWAFRSVKKYNITEIASQMAEEVAFRGPDDARVWADEREQLALAHRRLAVVDLSNKGAQPMVSPLGRYVIVYNGEVYNAAELRSELLQLGYTFRGTSDTEVMLACFEEWGIASATRRFIGMFAFAVWDRENRRLSLVRDRVGVKPLYFGTVNKTFFFGSQPKVFRKHPDWSGEIDADALETYFHLHYIPAPMSIYRGIRKLRPGTIVSIEQDGREYEEKYWDFDIVVDPLRRNHALTEKQALDQLDGLLRDSVKRRMIADVPVGAFLSGGIDSSLVVALMQSQRQDPVKTFSVRFLDSHFDEAPFAEMVASHLKTEHQTFTVTPQEAQEAIPSLHEYFDEPFADSSQIPTYLIAKLARQHVTVALSGDGGDELFAGYNRYEWGPRLWSIMRLLPMGLRKVMARLTQPLLQKYGPSMGRAILKNVAEQTLQDKLTKGYHFFMAGSEADLIRRIADQGGVANRYVLDAKPYYMFDRKMPLSGLSLWQYWDTMGYLPEDILTKVDRSTMAVSLEAREPLLDHRLVEWAWRLPPHMKIRYGQTKWLLRKLLERYVPSEYFDRPKMGFTVPLARWLREDLKDWAQDTILSAHKSDYPYLNLKLIQNQCLDHMKGEGNYHNQIWAALMFLQWEKHQ